MLSSLLEIKLTTQDARLQHICLLEEEDRRPKPLYLKPGSYRLRGKAAHIAPCQSGPD